MPLTDTESSKQTIRLTVNSKPVTARVEPRLQLAEFLREQLALTGTHLGCEHGVCGACTVEIDGAPARSCIAYAAACNGADVRTIEGYDGDQVMADLREAFSVEHALQCGYCTPGMLVTARDIVLRLPAADEARIRKELAGNLCRCTGYVGIVRAIQSVLAARARQGLMPAANAVAAPRSRVAIDNAAIARPAAVPAAPMPAAASAGAGPQTTLRLSFSVGHPRATVWDFFGRLDEVATCLPGISLRGPATDTHIDIKLRVKVGPIAPEFEGGADVVRDPANHAGTIRGSARDTRSNSRTQGEIRYVLADEKAGVATRVDLAVSYALTGALAQFSRSSIVQEIAQRMTRDFAQNLETRLSRPDDGTSADVRGATQSTELNAGSLLVAALWSRLKALLGFSRKH
ncbi:MAG: 2Fe-2S iron-sulfur cluster-binding protein [Betaproteobacteria bacterium]